MINFRGSWMHLVSTTRIVITRPRNASTYMDLPRNFTRIESKRIRFTKRTNSDGQKNPVNFH
jgi:hypothetical protein